MRETVRREGKRKREEEGERGGERYEREERQLEEWERERVC